ncbi:lactoylglutathione lyase-like lyase : Lactoylglutathione family lyase OS=Moorea producens 3L GN=LYNGBM3L_35820 PE=4 SV=1: Glyoxalase_2: Methyltransf_11 [Gemmata massiliana]|uniref:VOC domain-containing protein n=1 Tax=Gemmata massiliana TaxID=1210884 RepID=A0A6P2DN37_9BACT|nr:ArsI/CadI family heavy metal resistance metalloenzyme [Gemmata massiliana]VTS03417.1 lactoylglutathione lyase-like lyase : Lactoylglutathione family lyase OS=Moorea producens 3L GN=LYNGBM3L_35820 PE=4 SV=1: Glyoxalase_2: Methyltransf_11 [Gemmata massiliana]
MSSLTVIEEPVKFHMSLNVPDLVRAVEFYTLLFGLKPAKHHADYAKFELEDPPVIFSLAPHPPGPGASLSHIGLRVGSDETIQHYRKRLEAAGVCTQAQDGTVCGYAKQNKLWVTDPFGNFWEIYRVEEDVLPEMVRKSFEGKAARADAESGAKAQPEAVWEHFVTNGLPERIPHKDNSLDEVRLVGTFNAELTDAQRATLLKEVARVLKPGGKILTHGLMGDKPFPGAQPKLPGLAAMVAYVPAQTEPINVLRRAGFVGAQVVKFTEKAWFVADGVELREVKFVAWKPASPKNVSETKQVLYKGPFARATADGGHVFERGKRVSVPVALWEQLRLGPIAEQFLFFEPNTGAGCSSTRPT